MSDFNLNLLNHGNHLATGEFMDGLFSCTLFSLITLPSRMNSHSATLRGSVPKNGPIDFASKNHFSLNSADGKGLVPKY